MKKTKQSVVLTDGSKSSPSGSMAPGKSTAVNSKTKTSRANKSSLVSAFKGSHVTVASSTKTQPVTQDRSVRHKIQVFDDTGIDVTPMPLYEGTGTSSVKRPGSPQGTEYRSQPSFIKMTQGTLPQLGTQILGTTILQASRSTAMSEDEMNASMRPENEGPRQDSRSRYAVSPVGGEEQVLDEEQLNKEVEFVLMETETMWILDMIPTKILEDDPDTVAAQKETNQRYAQLCADREGNDRYSARWMQTFHGACKHKGMQTMPVETSEFGATATNWDIYDNTVSVEEDDNDRLPGMHDDDGHLGQDRDDMAIMDQTMATMGSEMKSRQGSVLSFRSETLVSAIDASQARAPGDSSSSIRGATSELELQKLASLASSLFVMERAVNQNSYSSRQALYRGMGMPAAPAPETPHMSRLWTFQCSLTKNQPVSCLVWNHKNPDIVVVGYGPMAFNEREGGLACCWSLKNPEWPERFVHCDSGVVSVDFSSAHPHIFAVGLRSGVIRVYNVKTAIEGPVADSAENPEKHTAPVWQVQFVERKGEERSESLMSISADGRVLQWSLRKGFESTELMRLKRAHTAPNLLRKDHVKSEEALISRYAVGLCFDFHPEDRNVYVVGTEDGPVHRCSCSYSEQYLDNHMGHKGPVYRIKWSPFSSDIFLSCSADWSVRVWKQGHIDPIITCTSVFSPVLDVGWSPTRATLFVCARESCIELWDLAGSQIDPIMSMDAPPGVKFTAAAFARNAECLIVGNSIGQVTVYQLKGLRRPDDASQDKALQKVISAAMDTGNDRGDHE